MIIEPIHNSTQVELMRQIYNENRQYMETKGPLPERTREAQLEWWDSLDHDKVKAWLHYDLFERLFLSDHNDERKLIGFSMLQNRGSFSTPMFAIKKEYHGKGYGREFIKWYLDRASRPLAGSQLQSNKAICHLNKEFGWKILCSHSGVDHLYHPGPNYWITLHFLDVVKFHHPEENNN